MIGVIGTNIEVFGNMKSQEGSIFTRSHGSHHVLGEWETGCTGGTAVTRRIGSGALLEKMGGVGRYWALCAQGAALLGGAPFVVYGALCVV